MSKRKQKQPRVRPHLELQSAVVDNPFFQREHAESRSNPSKIAAVVNVRESGIEYLYARKFIDEAQKRAADKFRDLWETMGGSGAGAIDYEKEKVDGGAAQDPISASQVNAGRELNRARNFLGEYGYRLVGKVAGEGYSPKEISNSDWERKVTSAMLRTFLDQLAEFWKFKSSAQGYQVFRVRMPANARKDGVPEFIVRPSSASTQDVMEEIRSARSDWSEFSMATVGPDRNMPLQEANDLALSLADRHRTTAMPFTRTKGAKDELATWRVGE